MDYRNPTRNAYGTIDVEINHPEFGWIPFTASGDDVEELGRALFADISKGEIAPYVAATGVPAPRATVLKSVVQARIIDAGKMDQAFALLTGNATYFARWFAPDRPSVFCDDPDAVGLVVALGLDPAVILAP